MNPILDKFGEFFIQNLRDRMFGRLEELLSGNAPQVQQLQDQLAGFTGAQKQVLRDMVEELITAGMHDLLFAIQEETDAGGPIKVLVDGQEVAKLSDGLHGEIFGDKGWIVRFSKYPSQVEIDRSKWGREFIAKMMARKDDNVA